MLNRFRLKNFKGWQDTKSIKMSPITLFFGVNSSGKSSIGQFLMMLRQTIEWPDRKAVFYPGGKNSVVQLGSYQEMVFHRDINNKIEFEYIWDLSKTFKFQDPITNKDFSGKSISFAGLVSTNTSDQNVPVVDKLDYKVYKEDGKESLAIGMERDSQSKSNYKVNVDHYPLKRQQGRVWYPGPPVRFYGFPDEVVAYHQNADFVQELNLAHEKFFRSVFYLGPLRTKTERLYHWPGFEPESVGYSGENTIAAILSARNRKIGLGYKRHTQPFEKIIAQKLKEMELIEEFKVNPISDQRQEYEVKVRTKGSQDFVDLPDVGFGVSQVLPVLVQIFYAPANSIIIMEQPEIHLHPRAQAALADVFIDAINSKENNQNRNIQLIVETHSEHFLRRLQRRIAQTKGENSISHEKISAYNAEFTTTSARLAPLEIDMFGMVRNWPKNFFGDEIGDITAQGKEAMKKKISMRNQPE